LPRFKCAADDPQLQGLQGQKAPVRPARQTILTPDAFTTARQRASSLASKGPNSFGSSRRGIAPRLANLSAISGDLTIWLIAAPTTTVDMSRTCNPAKSEPSRRISYPCLNPTLSR